MGWAGTVPSRASTLGCSVQALYAAPVLLVGLLGAAPGARAAAAAQQAAYPATATATTARPPASTGKRMSTSGSRAGSSQRPLYEVAGVQSSVVQADAHDIKEVSEDGLGPHAEGLGVGAVAQGRILLPTHIATGLHPTSLAHLCPTHVHPTRDRHLGQQHPQR